MFSFCDIHRCVQKFQAEVCIRIFYVYVIAGDNLSEVKEIVLSVNTSYAIEYVRNISTGAKHSVEFLWI
jgi:hypothetical protein